MSRDFVIGLVSGIGFMCIIAMTPIQNPGQDPNIRTLFDLVQSRQFRIEISSPEINEIREQEVLLMNTGDLKFVTRYGNARYFVKMSTF